MKLFNKWETSHIKVEDPGLVDYINIKPILVPKTFGRNTQKQFKKSNMHIVERLANHLYVSGHKRKKHYISSGHNTGKTMTVFNLLKDTFDIIEKKTQKNPIEVLVKAVENAAIREEVTSFQVGGIIVRKAVITSPQRRVDVVLREFVQGSYQKATGKKKTMAQALAEEILAAYENNTESYAISEKLRMEKEADSAR